MDLRPLTDDDLLIRLEALVAQERESVAEIVEHLAEVDRREIVVGRGYTSLWEYCVKRLRYSEGATALRIRAARASRYPGVLDDLREGKVTLDAIMRLYPHMDEGNSLDLLGQVAGATKREVLALVAKLDPTPPPERDVVRVVAAPRVEAATPAEIIPPVERLRYTFTADDDVARMLQHLRSFRKDASMNALLRAALPLLLKTVDPALKRTPPPPKPNAYKKRRIPAAVMAFVRARDQNRCSYIAPDGRRCEATSELEFDHIVPWSQGGRSDTPENIRLLCRAHNVREAIKKLGPRAWSKARRTADAASRNPPELPRGGDGGSPARESG